MLMVGLGNVDLHSICPGTLKMLTVMSWHTQDVDREVRYSGKSRASHRASLLNALPQFTITSLRYPSCFFRRLRSAMTLAS